jgi:hypothetical protein
MKGRESVRGREGATRLGRESVEVKQTERPGA